MSEQGSGAAGEHGASAGAVDVDTTQARRPPYMSYTTFNTYLDRIHEDGAPHQFDRSYFGNVSGSLVAQVLGAFTFLGLIDDKKQPTQLMPVVADPAQRKDILRSILEDVYAELVDLGKKNGTTGQLDAFFKQRGLNGDTVRKAAAFYLQAAESTGVTLSKNFTKPRPAKVNGAIGQKRSARKAAPKKSTPPPSPKVELPQASSLAAKRAAYVDMLMNLVQRSEDAPDADLLDRIERALGYDDETG